MGQPIPNTPQRNPLLDGLARSEGYNHPRADRVVPLALVLGRGAVILGQAKSTATVVHAEAFADKVRVFLDFFAEDRCRRLITVSGSWAIADPAVERLTRLGICALRMGQDTMELANAAALEAAAPGPQPVA